MDTIQFSIVDGCHEVFIKARKNTLFFTVVKNFRERQGYDMNKCVGFYLDGIHLTDLRKTLYQLNVINGCTIKSYPGTKMTFVNEFGGPMFDDALADTSSMFVVMHDCKTRLKIPHARFMYHNTLLTGQETPQSLGMENHNLVTVII